MIYIFLVVGVTHHGLVAIPIWSVTKNERKTVNYVNSCGMFMCLEMKWEMNQFREMRMGNEM